MLLGQPGGGSMSGTSWVIVLVAWTVGGGSSSRTERKGPNPAGGPERWELESSLRERRQWAPRWAALAELCGPQPIPHTYMVDESRDKVHAGCGATMQLGARETNGG